MEKRHHLANLALILVLLCGAWAYLAMPRAQYPEVNLNWVAVAAVWPGAPAQDVEHRLVLPLETAIKRVGDVRYVAASARDNVATLLVRFRDIRHATFEKRLQDLAREIQVASATDLPKDARPPQVIELTTSNVFPTAMVVVSGDKADGRVCHLASTVKADLEGMAGVGRVWAYGLRQREMQVRFDPDELRDQAVSPEALARTVAEQVRDYPAGNVSLGGQGYTLRVQGAQANPDFLAEIPIASLSGGQVRLGELAQVRTGIAPAHELVRLDGKPAVLLTVTKQEDINALALTDHIHAYIADKNQQLGGTPLTLADDQSESTRHAIRVMESNAVLGLILVLVIAWTFLGGRMALLVSVGVPFALAAMFFLLHLGGQSLNVSVLLGVAIVLGIPLDDAVVVAEAISLRLAAGMERGQAVSAALKEVAAPVTASIFATVLAFAPLMLLPGILGKFMFVVPLTVIVTLLASMAASLWILPSHVTAWRGLDGPPSQAERLRRRAARLLRRVYGRLLAQAFRRPALAAAGVLAVFALAVASYLAGAIQVQWFASDPLRVFNVNVTMNPTASLEQTLKVTRAVEETVKAHARPRDLRATLAVAGIQFTPTELLTGEHLGQVTVSLAPEGGDSSSVAQVVAELRQAVLATPGARGIAFQVLSADLPTLSAVQARLSGANLSVLHQAADALRREMEAMPALRDIRDDMALARPQVTLRLDNAAAARAGLDPFRLAALVRLHFEGVPVAQVVDGEEVLDVVIRARDMTDAEIQTWLKEPWRLPDGRTVQPGELFTLHFEATTGQPRRVNYQRAVTLQADLDKARVSNREAEQAIHAAWQGLATQYPGISLDFGSEMEDVKESLDALFKLFVLGIGLMYLWLAVQFGSFLLPLLILATAPMAFAGVALGLAASGQALSLYTLYGCVALGGVAVNASIVLVAAARDRLNAGFRPLSAAFHAARRRLVPILITTTAILGGLVSLAFGLGGQSLLWGPLAAAIVWGLLVATPLTLFATPMLYYGMARWLKR